VTDVRLKKLRPNLRALPQNSIIVSHLHVVYLGLQIGGVPMRRLTISTIAAISTIALTQFALAADWPRDAPAYTPPPPPPQTVSRWTGAYIGGNAGIAASSGSISGGVQAGHNWQSGSAVLGIDSGFNKFGTGR
jgi:hypothetical protein